VNGHGRTKNSNKEDTSSDEDEEKYGTEYRRAFSSSLPPTLEKKDEQKAAGMRVNRPRPDPNSKNTL